MGEPPLPVLSLEVGERAPAKAGRSGSKKRVAILEATLRVIGRDGIDRLTHRAIAEEAAVPLGLTTYYFSSKDDIVAQTLEYTAAREIERLGEQADALKGAAAPPDVVADLITTWIADQVNGEGRAELVAQYLLQLQSEHQPDLREALLEWNRATTLVAERTLAAIGSADPELDAPLLIAAVDGLRLNELARGELDQEGVRRQIGRLLDMLTRKSRAALAGRPS